MRKIVETSTLLIFMITLICCGFIEKNSIESDASGIVYDTQTDHDEDDVSVVVKEQLEHTDSLESSSDEIVTEEDDTKDYNTDESNSEEAPTEEAPTEEAPTEEMLTEEVSTENVPKEELSTEELNEEESSTENILTEDNFIEEDGIYSFFQRSEAWYQGVAWSGEWSTFEYKGRVFTDFGCGLCCMANVYDTLSPYEVSPKDMFFHAMNVSGYAPSSAGAAISWWNMKNTLTKSGIVCQLYHKPSSYTDFQQQIHQCKSAIVLVSCVYDNTYWTTTKGHYVSIWNYDEESDTVFLADPGKISRNRQRIPLRYVYNALKLSSDYQFLTITEYVEENNTWKGNGITEQWYRP